MRNRWPGAFLSFLMLAYAAKALGADGPAVPVGAATAERRDVPVYLQGIGTVQAFNTVAIHPQAEGQLVKVAFTEGQEVHAGDLLAQIDPRPYQAALDQAVAKKAQDEALLANAKLDVQRYAGLVEKNYVARQQLDTTRAQAAQLEAAAKGDEAAIQAARIQLGYTTIRSPIDGRAGIRQVDQGNIVHSFSSGGSTGGSGSGSGGSSSSGSGSSGGNSDALVVIAQLHPISVIFTLPQEELPRLLQANAKGKLGVAVFGRAGGDALDQGQLEVIDNQIDPATGTVRLKATLPNKNGLLWPGQFVNAKLLLDTRAQSVTVPDTAIQRGAQGDYVFIVRDDHTVESRTVVTGTLHDGTAEVLQGLTEGETVVASGHYRLRPGIKVAIETANTASQEPVFQKE